MPLPRTIPMPAPKSTPRSTPRSRRPVPIECLQHPLRVYQSLLEVRA
jgi:hypothetical protein